jgi:transposase InsO family protein
MSIDPFIKAEEVKGRSVSNACRLLEVSRAAFYQRRLAIPSPRAVSDDELAKKITAIHTESKGTYGSPRVHRALRKQGTECGKRRVRKLMGQAGLEGRVKKRWRKTTIADPEAEAALDLIRRYFGPGVEVDTRYVGDITYIATSWIPAVVATPDHRRRCHELTKKAEVGNREQAIQICREEGFLSSLG